MTSGEELCLIVGCHLSGLPNRATAAKLNRFQSTVAFVLATWNVDGNCRNAKRSERSKTNQQKSQNPETLNCQKWTQPMVTIPW